MAAAHRKAICALALLFHVATESDETAVSLACLMRALAMLVDHGWLSESEIETGGSPGLDYLTHPKLFTE
ncbi:hypothetical protein [Prosthecobacter fusiformis]|uniref:hypothetical protein n=1 Tax=Prosthecobacter fusiformis TaxID=48464 RepID=UPI001414D109|nr:hypothetical protein [Prosthecobacter fusiformis]